MMNSAKSGDSKHTSDAPSRVDSSERDRPAPVERKSPPTDRVVGILNLLAATPRARLTLTQIAAALDLNKPTCLGILTALADANFTTRDEAKTYGLGPALIRLGSAAESGLANLDLVRPFLADLHDSIGVSCILTAVHDNHIVILDKRGPAAKGDRRDLVGERFPLAPPLGLVNVAWEHDSVVDEWLNRTPLAPLPHGDDAVRAIIRGGRERGYIVECLNTSTASSVVLASLLVSEMPQRVIDEVRSHLPPVDWSEFVAVMPVDSAAAMAVANISAPIFDRHGNQQYTVTLVSEQADVSVTRCRDWAAAVVDTARAATAALGGATT